MNIYSYDNALKEKLLAVFENVVNCSEDRVLIESEAGSPEATVALPLISFWRLTSDFDIANFNYPSMRRGRPMQKLNETTRLNVYEVPINLSYQIDVWSDRQFETDQLYQELLFYFLQEPYLDVLVESDNNIQKFYFNITDTNTSIELSEFSENGSLYRQTITINCDSAKLGLPVERDTTKKLEIRTVLVNNEGDEFITSVVDNTGNEFEV